VLKSIRSIFRFSSPNVEFYLVQIHLCSSLGLGVHLCFMTPELFAQAAKRKLHSHVDMCDVCTSEIPYICSSN